MVLARGFKRVRLMGVQGLDTRARQGLPEGRMEVIGQPDGARLARAEPRLRHHLLAATGVDEPLPGRCLPDHGH